MSALSLMKLKTLKTSSSLAAQCAYDLKGRMRIAVTGTPIENRWEDLWSLFHFLHPQLLGERQEFSAKMLSAQVDSRYLVQLKKKVRPFILRRCKKRSCRRSSSKIRAGCLGGDGGETKRDLRRMAGKASFRAFEKGARGRPFFSSNGNTGSDLASRQICCHPLLVDGSLGAEEGQMSAKFERFIEDMESVVEEITKSWSTASSPRCSV